MLADEVFILTRSEQFGDLDVVGITVMIFLGIDLVLGEHMLHIGVQLALQYLAEFRKPQPNLGSAVVEVNDRQVDLAGGVQCRE